MQLVYVFALWLAALAPAYAQSPAAAPSAPTSGQAEPALPAAPAAAPSARTGAASNPFLRKQTPAPVAPTSIPELPVATEPLPVLPPVEAPAAEEEHPVKTNGKRIGVVNGKVIYRDGEAYYFEDEEEAAKKLRRLATPGLPPAPGTSGTAVPPLPLPSPVAPPAAATPPPAPSPGAPSAGEKPTDAAKPTNAAKPAPAPRARTTRK